MLLLAAAGGCDWAQEIAAAGNSSRRLLMLRSAPDVYASSSIGIDQGIAGVPRTASIDGLFQQQTVVDVAIAETWTNACERRHTHTRT